MNEPLKKEKEETLEEWQRRVYDYDPSPEELKKCYSKEFFEKLKQI